MLHPQEKHQSDFVPDLTPQNPAKSHEPTAAQPSCCSHLGRTCYGWENCPSLGQVGTRRCVLSISNCLCPGRKIQAHHEAQLSAGADGRVDPCSSCSAGASLQLLIQPQQQQFDCWKVASSVGQPLGCFVCSHTKWHSGTTESPWHTVSNTHTRFNESVPFPCVAPALGACNSRAHCCTQHVFFPRTS